ncbi:MAG: penicillin-binding protein 1C [Nitrospirae bacterium]|nr:penicillin-binding protein 1C [Nitrospirota bacterium]
MLQWFSRWHYVLGGGIIYNIWIYHLKKKLILTLIIIVLALLCAAYLVFFSGGGAQQSYQQVRDSYKASEAVLLDRNMEVIHELRIDTKGRRLAWQPLKDISPAVVQAIIHTEDKRFYAHHGVDWRAIASISLKKLTSGTRRGGSTITMQLASIFNDGGFKPKKGRRSFLQKISQIKAALALERQWTKDEILEGYLNLVSYRGELSGIGAAARGLFDKDPSGLTQSQALLLAALVGAPNAAYQAAGERACKLAQGLQWNDSCGQIKILAYNTLSVPYQIRPRTAFAPHAARLLIKNGKQEAVSTLDGELQRLVLDRLDRHLIALKENNVSDGAVLVAENKTGEILAYVGNGGGAYSSAVKVDGIRSERQAGSTLKPFLYELALERGFLTAASILDDSPLRIQTTSGLFIPQNYGKDFKGQVSARTALSSSLNVPAVRVLEIAGLEAFTVQLKVLGFKGLREDAEFYGYSIALGSLDITLFELVNAYRTLANGGMMGDLTLTPQPGPPVTKQILDARAVYIISNILSDRGARSLTFGFDNPLATRFWTAVKTGTSKDMRDNWCVGYSERYTVGVWVGNFSGEPMKDVSGITGAAPLWTEIMNYLHSAAPSNAPAQPSGVMSGSIAFEDDVEPDRSELFIAGTEPVKTQIRLNKEYETPRITYPPSETIISLDPDIGEANQMVVFQYTPQHERLTWTLNGEKLGTQGTPQLWKPKKGSYRLSIVNNEGKNLDTVSFQVR